MARRSGGKRSKNAAGAAITVGERVVRLEKALAAALKREAKAASRLEAVRVEVAVLRLALAEVVGEVTAAPSTAAIEVAEPPKSAAPVKPKAAAAKAAPTAAAPRAAAKPTAKPAATAKAAAPRRTARPGPGAGAPDR